MQSQDPDEEDEETQQKDSKPGVRDAAAVLNCLKRALKMAHTSQQQLTLARKSRDTTPVLLFIEILNKYLYFFEQEVPSITNDDIQVHRLSNLNPHFIKAECPTRASGLSIPPRSKVLVTTSDDANDYSNCKKRNCFMSTIAGLYIDVCDKSAAE